MKQGIHPEFRPVALSGRVIDTEGRVETLRRHHVHLGADFGAEQ